MNLSQSVVALAARRRAATLRKSGDRGTFNPEKLVAIVDDDANVRESLERLVYAFGYAASAFATAEEYLCSDVVRDTACLISDVELPGINGPDLQARLIADGYRIPIVFVSGFCDETVRARVLAAGAVNYLAKPCNPESLMDCIEKALVLS